MNPSTTRVLHLVQGAIIAALYTVLTMLAALAGLAYGPVQFRFSEALTILPIFTATAIPGLTIGCLLSNIYGVFIGLGPYDLVFGTAATLLAAIGTRLVRNIRFRGLPVLAPLPPVLFNAVIIGVEITLLSGGFAWGTFWAAAGSVGLGELVICYALGLPLATLMDKNKKLKALLQ